MDIFVLHMRNKTRNIVLRKKLLIVLLLMIFLLPARGAFLLAQQTDQQDTESLNTIDSEVDSTATSVLNTTTVDSNSNNTDQSNSTAESNTADSSASNNSENQTQAAPIIEADQLNSIPSDNQTALPFPGYDQELEQRKQKSAEFLGKIHNEIKSSENQLMNINSNMVDTQSKLVDTQDKVLTLQDQLDNLNQRIELTTSKIEDVTKQIAIKKSEIDQLVHQIELKTVESANQKRLFLEYLQVIYKKQNDFNTLSADGTELNTLKLLLSDEKAGETLTALRYSEIFEDQGRQIIGKLSLMLEEEQTNQKILTIKKRTLMLMQKKLEDEKRELESEKEAKANLLEQTKGQELIFKELLDASMRQQEEVLQEIDNLRKNMNFIMERIAVLGTDFDPNNYLSLLTSDADASVYSYLSTPEAKEFNPIWPVPPIRGISAYYLEQSYYSHFGFQHNAIDIRAYQSTPVHAASDGIVFKAKNNGYGYSYIILAHKSGFMSVYGHISEIMVTPGQIVKAGDVIGLSGGMPGTKGAGVYTTGPHLHFEIIKDGVHVDPMYFVNLAYLDLANIPEKYILKALGDREKVLTVKPKVRVKPLNQTVEQLVEQNGDGASISSETPAEIIPEVVQFE
jgi:murein DD-endopeptidase MepM/ murein hydrolase activator NlpD